MDYFILANRLANQKKYQQYADIQVIENFLSTKYIDEFKTIDNPCRLIYHGQLSEERGLIDLIEAFNSISQTNTNLELI